VSGYDAMTVDGLVYKRYDCPKSELALDIGDPTNARGLKFK